MWTLKISIQTDDTFLFGKYTKKHNVSLFAYPNSYNMEKDKTCINGSGIIIGNNKNIDKFICDMKKDKRVINLEIESNFVVFSIKEPPKIKMFLNSSFIFVKPPLFASNGEYIFEIACINREKLNNLIQVVKKSKFAFKLHSFKKTKLTHIQTAYVYPNLTEKQKRCFQAEL